MKDKRNKCLIDALSFRDCQRRLEETIPKREPRLLAKEEMRSSRTVELNGLLATHVIYFLLDIQSRVLYVGMTRNLMSRLASHARSKQFASVVYMTVPKDDAKAIEKQYIDKYKPPLNKELDEKLWKRR